MGAQAIHLAGATISFDPDWLDDGAASVLFDVLHGALPWERHRITVYGRTLDAPRLSCWIGDPDATYVYSGTRFVPHPWHPALRAVRDRLARELGTPFNSVLANLYRDGRDRLGFHRDNEPELGPRPVIASVSLGATRRFRFKGEADSMGIDLTHGSLLVMSGDTQVHYRHAVPPTARAVRPRINLTFRRITPARAVPAP